MDFPVEIVRAGTARSGSTQLLPKLVQRRIVQVRAELLQVIPPGISLSRLTVLMAVSARVRSDAVTDRAIALLCGAFGVPGMCSPRCLVGWCEAFAGSGVPLAGHCVTVAIAHRDDDAENPEHDALVGRGQRCSEPDLLRPFPWFTHCIPCRERRRMHRYPPVDHGYWVPSRFRTSTSVYATRAAGLSRDYRRS